MPASEYTNKWKQYVFQLVTAFKKKNTQKSKERKSDETVGGKGIKETPAQMISRDHCKMLKHTYIEKNLQMTASVDSFTTFIAIWLYLIL